MGSVAGPELAAAVTGAGALGMLGMPAGADALRGTVEQLRSRTDGPVGINFLMPFLDRDAVEVAAELLPLVEFFYGEPDASLVALVHAGGALAAWQVGSLAEAQAAEDAGCDLVIAQGVEAGGHVRGTSARTALLHEVLGVVRVPVVAAGGIGTAEDVGAVLAAGAAAARVGTRFVATAEADAHADYQRALVTAEAHDTVLTTAFSVLWPDAPHRVLAASVRAAEAHPGDDVGFTPAPDGARMPIPRLSPIPPSRTTEGTVGAMALYAGESVSAVRAVAGAADVVRELAAGIDQRFTGYSR